MKTDVRTASSVDCSIVGSIFRLRPNIHQPFAACFVAGHGRFPKLRRASLWQHSGALLHPVNHQPADHAQNDNRCEKQANEQEYQQVLTLKARHITAPNVMAEDPARASAGSSSDR
ncbi:hypothetical protein [Pseudaminobacter salicylatoxidans]|uniref:hypothetical protein n=1 Tax=Pseudaminobacter salicylatoxidans TaxID=93369 RepID=UPI0011B22E53|nr:hypothetical protein [Pseudaminobacter salicylatoxidans]